MIKADKKIPLTETILQRIFKQKTILRNADWDIIWFLGGKNKVEIGEKSGKFYLLPHKTQETIVAMLPCGIIEAKDGTTKTTPVQISTLQNLEKFFPELKNFIDQGKIIIE